MKCLAWIGLLLSIGCPLNPGYRPFQQSARRCNSKVLPDIKAKITRLIEAKFIRHCRYAEWISNMVPVYKKNGKLHVCIDFRDLNKATPMDGYCWRSLTTISRRQLDQKIMRVCISYMYPYPIKFLNHTLPFRICKLCFQANMQVTSTLWPTQNHRKYHSTDSGSNGPSEAQELKQT